MTGLLIGAVVGLALVVVALYWLLWQAWRELAVLRRYEHRALDGLQEISDRLGERRELVIAETLGAQDLPEAEPGIQPHGMRTWRGLPPGERDPRFPSIHPAVWNATGTPADPVVGDVPAVFWDEVANIHVDGSDMSP